MLRPKAWSLLRSEPAIRRDSFAQGLAAAGFEPRTGPPASMPPGDALAIWNRYGEAHELASRFERAGGIVLVAENGYLGPGGRGAPGGSTPKFDLDGGMRADHTSRWRWVPITTAVMVARAGLPATAAAGPRWASACNRGAPRSILARRTC